MHGLQACLFKYITVAAFRIYGQRGEDSAKGEVGGHALNSHGHYFVNLLIMENHGKIMELIFEILWEPCNMLKTFVYLDLSSFIEVKLADLYSKIKMQGWKILKISNCTTCPCVCKFNSLHWKQSKFLLILKHKVPVMVSG